MDRIKQISPLDAQAMERAQACWEQVAKPLHSLGLLEEAVIQIAGITGNEDVRLDHRQVIVLCGDNGVVAEGVTQTDSSVTAKVAAAVAGGTSNINVMADALGAVVVAVDLGISGPPLGGKVLSRRIAPGTGNIARGPAMRLSQATAAVCAGMDLVRESREQGCQILFTGEMGIGNTTPTAALASVLLGIPPHQATGRGAGLSRAGLARKVEAVRRAIQVNRPDPSRPLELLSKLGCYEIAGMVGLFLGGAVYRVPVVIDGVISAAAALLAVKLAPLCRGYMLCSHVSKEPAGPALLARLGLTPLIDARLCLGEGSGGLLLLPLLDAALAVYHNAHRFEGLGMERYQEWEN
ncbi:nicotinate-nucleotide--dimethylbenzimidazole phosphoribosyltransferase [Acutalibacter caecimuris]|uniref:nicotinate-nucleotide--dimethylbenzimidazole phosphoribosyltransferase n=1 Tax=Acutalibacter caecimuris TaxID=3093657 RepID=UPI002AC9ACE4|nr:nicotinate-nucleotide--dimethylbenzimidazole phosphoribosyltransferase [Acutalibacter sp. M00118]